MQLNPHGQSSLPLLPLTSIQISRQRQRIQQLCVCKSTPRIRIIKLEKPVQRIPKILKKKFYDLDKFTVDQHLAGWKPFNKYFCSIVFYNSAFYLFGGLFHSPFNKISRFQHGQWQPHDELVINNNRMGHSATVLGSKLVIFGGIQPSQTFQNNVLDLQTGKMQIIKPTYYFNQNLKRLYHICLGVSKRCILLHGGQYENGKIRGLSCYNFQKNNYFDINSMKCPKLYMHAGCCVMTSQLLFNGPYDFRLIPSSNYTIDQGIFVFGGYNQKGQIQATLYQLQFNNAILSWKIPKCQGKKPSPRINHGMAYLRLCHSIVVFMGQTFDPDTKQMVNLNDLNLLSLDKMEWFRVEQEGRLPRLSCFGSSSDENGQQILIFGGFDQDHRIDGRTFLIKFCYKYL